MTIKQHEMIKINIYMLAPTMGRLVQTRNKSRPTYQKAQPPILEIQLQSSINSINNSKIPTLIDRNKPAIPTTTTAHKKQIQVLQSYPKNTN